MPGLVALRAFCVAALVLACGAPVAAQTAPGDVSIDPIPIAGGAAPEHFLFFAGYDLWQNAGAGYAGFHWAPDGLNSGGFALRVLFSNDIEHYGNGRTEWRTGIVRASVLAGWQFKIGDAQVKLFAGPDLEDREFTPVATSPPFGGVHGGVRALAEFWWEPLDAMMLTGLATATSIANATSARIASGWRTPENFWVGPEALFSRDDYSTQYRFGGHLTGLRAPPIESLPPFEWSVAGGFVHDSLHRSGAYLRIGVLARQ